MTEQQDTRIFEYMTKTAWLHFEDNLAIGKIKLFGGRYKPGEGAQLSLVHYVDVDTIRPLLHDLSWGKQVEFVDYKGSPTDGGQAISRVLRVNGKDGKVFFALTHGPGTLTPTGAVMPQKTNNEADKQSLNVGMDAVTARQMAYCVLEYLIAYRTAGIMTVDTRKTKAGIHVPELSLENVADELGLMLPQEYPPGKQPLLTLGKVKREQEEERRFVNGKLCPPDLYAIYDQFSDATQEYPRSQEHLMDWAYRN